MALKSGFFDSVSGDRKYSANDLSNIWVKFISNGVYADPATSLQVTANSGMTVKVSPGWAFINSKWLKNDDDYILTIDDSDAEYTRIDRIVVRLDPSDDARTITLEVKTGTPGNTVEDLTRESNGIWELSLAQIYVTANSTEISQGVIVDERANTDVCGWVTGLIDQIDTTNLFAQYDSVFQNLISDTTISKTITQLILYGISGLHPDYTHITFSETVETEDDKTMTLTLDTSLYSPEDYDGLLVVVDGILLDPSTYTTTFENNAAHIYFSSSAGLEIGQTVECHIYKKPSVSATSAVLSGSAYAVSDGSTAEAASNAATSNSDGASVQTISGTAEPIIDEEE